MDYCQSALSWCLQALRYATPHHQGEIEDQEEAMQIRRMLDEVRVKNFKVIFRLCAALFAFIVPYFLQHQEATTKYSGLVVTVLLMYPILLFISYSHCHWTPIKVTAVTTVLQFIFLARTCSIQDQGVWFLQSNNRAMLRLVMGIADMDHRRVAMWNVVFFFANVIKTMNMTENVIAVQRPLSDILVTEGSVCMLFWAASYIAQMWVTEGVRIAFESSRSRIDKSMTDHLLSAFCDAQIKLGSNLQLVGPHEKLDRILLVNSPARSELLQGTSFLDYIASADKARFKAFIETSSAPSEHCATVSSNDSYERPKTLPSALHLHLRDFSGRYLPASIFHSAAINADRESYHLIGICVDSPEEFIGALQIQMDSAEQANEGSQAGQDFPSHLPSKKKSSSLSSRSSSSSRSKGSVGLIDLPQVKRVSVAFDPFEWSIHKISWHLQDAANKVPAVDACMLQPDGQEFRRWVQDQVGMLLFTQNETSDQESRSAVYGSLALTLPQICCSKQNPIFAKSAWLSLEDLDEFDDESDLVSLELEGVQQISGTGRLKAVMSTINE